MSDEPSLPRLPAVSWDEQSQSFSNNPLKRARARRGDASPQSFSSSDPAVFSSDDDPGLDNYVEGRRKKRYVGSWFQQQPASSDSALSDGPSRVLPKIKRTLRRDFDSGVFLGSDSTDSDGVLEGLETAPNPKLPQLEKRIAPRISQAELIAQRKIQDCLDQGDESVDLWSLGLENISDDTINRLSQFTCIPVVAKDVAFEQKEPELKLFLALNSLQRIPGSLFDLTHLTVLSLRANQLTDLPPGISKLRNLKQLNIAQNHLRYLPAELLDLLKPNGKLRELTLYPNPLLQPEQPFSQGWEEGDAATDGAMPMLIYDYAQPLQQAEVPNFFSRYLGRSPLQFSDSNGQVISDFRLPLGKSSGLVPIATENTTDSSASSQIPPIASLRKVPFKPSVVPSLLEVALRSCYNSSQLSELESYIPDGLSHLQELLRRAVLQKDAGGLNCSRCRRMIVVPPIEWVEWREIRTYAFMVGDEPQSAVATRPFSKAESEMAVPFSHRACSSRCGPTPPEDADRWHVLPGHQNI